MDADWLRYYDQWVRLVCFLLCFSALACWELYVPWRWVPDRGVRWMRHGFLVLVSTVLVRILFPVFTVEMARQVALADPPMGLFHVWAPAYPIQVFLAVVLLDFVIYVQHRYFHKFQWLWRIHRVHHVDKALDVSTGFRFHPLEALISTGVKLVAIISLGAPMLAVFIFEVLLNAASMFTHTNVQLPPKLERVLRWVIVTPDMHRVHHSDIPAEHNSNFGFCLSIWDRIGNSYLNNSRMRERVIFGIEAYREPRFERLSLILLLPFRIRLTRVKAKPLPPTHRQTGA